MISYFLIGLAISIILLFVVKYVIHENICDKFLFITAFTMVWPLIIYSICVMIAVTIFGIASYFIVVLKKW
jgi:hypothetical protein